MLAVPQPGRARVAKGCIKCVARLVAKGDQMTLEILLSRPVYTIERVKF